MALQLRDMIDKWKYMKLKSFHTTKELVTRLKRQATEWEKIYASYTFVKGLITRIYRELKKLDSPKISDPIKKWANELNRVFSKEEIEMAKKPKTKQQQQNTHEEMLSIPSHKGSANQIYVKIPSHRC
jgi:hypothetical protein